MVDTDHKCFGLRSLLTVLLLFFSSFTIAVVRTLSSKTLKKIMLKSVYIQLNYFIRSSTDDLFRYSSIAHLSQQFLSLV